MKKLADGDTIALVAPAFHAAPEIWDGAEAALRARGFQVKCFGREAVPEGRFAAPDAARAGFLQAAFEDRETAAILAVRGGCGCSRLLDHLDFARIAANPKPFVGYSDATVLLVALASRAAMPAFHGPMGVDLARDGAGLDGLLGVLTGADETLLLDPLPGTVLREGRAEGALFGGNLAVLVSMIGTPEFEMPEGAVLILEEVNEFGYRIDRALTHLKRAGIFARAGAVLVGKTSVTDVTEDGAMRDLIADYLADISGPVATDLDFGHQAPLLTLPHGHRLSLSVTREAIRLDFPGLWRAGTGRVLAAE